MEKEKLKRIFEFLEEKDNKRTPLKWKLTNDFDSIDDKDLFYDDNFDLYGARIERLPDNFTVKGYLDLRLTKIKTLPDNLTIDGDLHLTALEIDSVPKNLKAHSMYAKYTTLSEKYSYKEIKDMIKENGGEVKFLTI